MFRRDRSQTQQTRGVVGNSVNNINVRKRKYVNDDMITVRAISCFRVNIWLNGAAVVEAIPCYVL